MRGTKKTEKEWVTDAIGCYTMRLFHYTNFEIAKTYQISEATVKRYSTYVKHEFPGKPTLDEMIQAFQVMVKTTNLEYHNMREDTQRRVNALALTMKSQLELARLLGYLKPDTQIQALFTPSFMAVKITSSTQIEDIVRDGGIEYAATHSTAHSENEGLSSRSG